FARRLKTLHGLTPYEAICAVWAKQPERFRLNPVHLTSGLNT
ncbi:IS481 family transposase, partial [Mesorhizobium sp. M1C.F.Ca.ET.193.01.1.1]